MDQIRTTNNVQKNVFTEQIMTSERKKAAEQVNTSWEQNFSLQKKSWLQRSSKLLDHENLGHLANEDYMGDKNLSHWTN
jgi:capsid portal protein